jgi:hypothetical protein
MAISIKNYQELINEIESAPSLNAIDLLLKHCLNSNLIHFSSNDEDAIEALKTAKKHIVDTLVKYEHTEKPLFFYTSDDNLWECKLKI